MGTGTGMGDSAAAPIQSLEMRLQEAERRIASHLKPDNDIPPERVERLMQLNLQALHENSMQTEVKHRLSAYRPSTVGPETVRSGPLGDMRSPTTFPSEAHRLQRHCVDTDWRVRRRIMMVSKVDRELGGDIADHAVLYQDALQPPMPYERIGAPSSVTIYFHISVWCFC